MTRIYLAGPMRGMPDENRVAFEIQAAELRSLGHFVFNPAENKTGNLRESMAIDLAWIALCAEAVATLPGSEKSLGACAEVALAHAIGIPVSRAIRFRAYKKED
jgi:hypothetical protein